MALQHSERRCVDIQLGAGEIALFLSTFSGFAPDSSSGESFDADSNFPDSNMGLGFFTNGFLKNFAARLQKVG